VLEGTPCADVIVAPEGVTSIDGGSGNGTIVAGDGVLEISGGPGSDLLVGSSEVEVIIGGDGPGEDNITWAALEIPQRSMTKGVHANVDNDKVGQPPGSTPNEIQVQGTPSCPDKNVNEDLTDDFDTIPGVEHLEGSGGWDTLIGGDAGNTLLGRAGADKHYGGGGDDKLRTNADDYESVIDCGPGDDDLLKDPDRTDMRDSSTGASCDSIQTSSPEYNFAHDVNVLGSNPDAIAVFRLGEHEGNRVYNADGIAGGADSWIDSDAYYIGSPDKNQMGSVPMVEDRATMLNSNDDWIKLGDPWNSVTNKFVLDPSNYSATGFSVEIWVKLNSNAGVPGANTFQYLISRFLDDGSKGFFIRRNSNEKIVFGVKWTNGTVTSAVSASNMEPGSGWHQVVGTLKDNTLSLYVDENKTTEINSTGVFLPTVTNKAVRISEAP
jgi:Ca2+-binding RTX toxin-like protein